MPKNQHVVLYRKFANSIIMPLKINSFIITHFASAINEYLEWRQYRPLLVDFVAVQKPYSNGMLPIIAMITRLRNQGHDIKIRLPNDQNVANLFIRTNWAYLLNSSNPRSNSGYDRHLHTRQFKDDRDVAMLTNDFMDVILRSMDKIPKDIISALEWSMYEICDNVINHSESESGGFVEAVTYSKEQKICFTVADAGRGILHSLKEGLPDLTSNVQAIGEALKAGVTRNKKLGQGNGLAGSSRITTMTGGSLDITSGSGRIYCTSHHSNELEGNRTQFYSGTSVSGQINTLGNFSIGKALQFDGVEYIPLNIIDLEYELPDEDALLISIKRETTGVGTRKSGRQLRSKLLNMMGAKPGYPVYIDWDGIPVISSSFADEFIGKLYLEIGGTKFNMQIRNKNMEILIQQLLDKAISQRLNQ